MATRSEVEPARWRVDRASGGDARFAYRIRIVQRGRVLWSVRAREPWPAPGAQTFCLREPDAADDDLYDDWQPVEDVPVASLARFGRKLSVTLDRPQRKRCEFIVIAKPRKAGGEVEQVFFRTEAALRAHHTATWLELWHGREAELEVLIDSRERYAWQFPGAAVERGRLDAGDYALRRAGRLLAVVERKTLPNLRTDFGQLRALHHALAQLAAQPQPALVIEAQYGDAVDPVKMAPFGAVYLARAIAELQVFAPRLPIVWAGNRKLANLWTQRWFGALLAQESEQPRLALEQPLAKYDAVPPGPSLDARIATALQRRPEGAAVAELAQACGSDAVRVRRVLGALRAAGHAQCSGRGRAARWIALRR